MVPGTRKAAARFAREDGPRWRLVPETVPETTEIAHRATSTIRAYFLLTKPRVVELLLVTTVPAMILAEEGLPSLTLIGAVLLGGALAAGGANTINCWIERDRDRLMHRTQARPLPAGRIEPGHALIFGIVLEAVAFVWLWGTVNLLAASLAVSAMLFYVFVYTIWLKPRSPQNIVIGGAAGAVPVLVGWAAVTGQLDAPAWVLFAIVFCWTPPHFWALSLRYRDDYAAAGIPMLPVARGVASAVRQILVYSLIVVAVTLLLFRFETMGVIYLAAAVALGVAFVWQAFALWRDASPKRAMRLFSFSNTYLALLFAAIAVDTLVRAV
jgi:heme o synthase